jgi:hypothetical protein
MGGCDEEAHWFATNPAGCFPNTDSWPLVGVYSIPISSRWSASEYAESSKHGEGMGSRLSHFLRPIRESLSPSAFLDETVAFLRSIGVVHVVSLDVDGANVYTVQGSEANSVEEFEDAGKKYFESHPSPKGPVEVRVVGRNDHFLLDMSIQFRPVHSSHDDGLAISVQLRPVVLEPMEGESVAEHGARVDKLVLDSHAVERLKKEDAEQALALKADLEHHISESYPNLGWTLSEADETSQAAGLGPS